MRTDVEENWRYIVLINDRLKAIQSNNNSQTAFSINFSSPENTCPQIHWIARNLVIEATIFHFWKQNPCCWQNVLFKMLLCERNLSSRVFLSLKRGLDRPKWMLCDRITLDLLWCKWDGGDVQSHTKPARQKRQEEWEANPCKLMAACFDSFLKSTFRDLILHALRTILSMYDVEKRKRLLEAGATKMTFPHHAG